MPGCPGVVATMFHEDEVGVVVPSTPTGESDCMAVVRWIAAAFDAELRVGAHQDLFVVNAAE